MENKKIYGNPKFDKPEEFLTEEEFLNKKVGRTNKTVAQIDEIYPGFKEKFAKQYNTGIADKEVIQQIVNADVFNEEELKKINTKNEWKERVNKGNVTQNDINHLVDVMFGKEKELKPPEKQKEEPKQEVDEEHKQFCDELKTHTYSPEQAAKNTAVREQKELNEQTKQQTIPQQEIPEEDQPII